MINTLTWPTSCGLLDITHSEARGIFKLEFRALGIYADRRYCCSYGIGDIFPGDDFDYVYPAGTSEALLSKKPKSVKMISEGCVRGDATLSRGSAVKITYEITTRGHTHIKSIKIPEARDETPVTKTDIPVVATVETKTEPIVTKKVEAARDQALDLVIVLAMTFGLVVLVNFIQFAIFSIIGIKVPWIVFYILLDRTSYYPLGLLLYYGLKNLH